MCREFDECEGELLSPLLLPVVVCHLTFGYHFNQQVANLSSVLTYLIFKEQFNQPIDLPSRSLLGDTSTTHSPFFTDPSVFWRQFHQLRGFSSTMVTYLSFQRWFNQPVNNLPLPLCFSLLGLNSTNSSTLFGRQPTLQ